MNNIKKAIIIISILVVILVVLLIGLIKNKEEHMNISEYRNNADQIIISQNWEEVKNETMYFTVKNCIQMYLEERLNNKESSNYMDMLSEKYVNENNNSNDELLNYKQTDNELGVGFEFKVNKMKMLDYGNIQNYAVLGKLGNLEGAYIVTLDNMNMTFMLNPIEKTKYQNIEIVENDIEVIEENEHNKFGYVRLKEPNIINEYVTDFKEKCFFSIKEAYNILDDEYKEKRFNNFDEFNKYIKDNLNIINRMVIYSYINESEEDYNRYICINKYDETWIFKSTAAMQYTVILDTYTLDLPEFLEKYNSTNNQGKTALNIQKCIQAINSKDYSYVYSKLDETFKTNYFKTEKDFSDYIKEHTFEINNIEYKEYSLQGQNNIYELILTDKTGNNTGSKNFNIVMQLKEGTDFVMSFEVN